MGKHCWINKNIKSALLKRSRLTKRHYLIRQVQTDYDLLIIHSKGCTDIILSFKKEYFLSMSKKLSNPSTTPASYWSTFS